MSEEERPEDAFNEVIKRFASIESFTKFALSKDGLKLDNNIVTNIKKDFSESVYEQERQMLLRWSEKQGSKANAAAIREKVRFYFEDEEDEPNANEPPAQIKHSNGPQNVTITNIYGGMSGPLLIGNENVSMGGGKGQMSGVEPALDDDLPKLKASNSVISAEGGEIRIGSCCLEFPANSVAEDTTANVTYLIIPSQLPEGYVRSSATLQCDPPYEGKKCAKVTLPTWCSTRKSVDVGIFSMTEEGWKEIDRPILTHEGNLELQYRNLSNITAFIPVSRLPDVQFSVSCFLYNDPDGRFAMCFCLRDPAVESIMQHSLKKQGFHETVKDLKPLVASLGDEILFKISPGQPMQNTKLEIDEAFVSSFVGFVSYCKVDKEVSKPQYIVEQIRSQEGASQEIDKQIYPIDGKEAVTKRRPAVEIAGNVEAQNFIGEVDSVSIDQRTFAAGDNAAEPMQTNNQLSYKEKKSEKKKETLAEQYGGAGPRGDKGGVFVRGDIKANNVIGSAKVVTIDQRRGGAKRRRGPGPGPTPSRMVEAQQPSDEKNEEKLVEEGVAEEGPEDSNKATPFKTDDGNDRKEDEKERPREENAGLKEQQEEIKNEVRKRKPEAELASHQEETKKKKKEETPPAIDLLHVALFLGLLASLAYIWYSK